MKTWKKPPKKRPVKPFTGTEGKFFSATNQPTPEQKKIGWEERKKERLFTGQVWEQLVGEDGMNLRDFTKKMISLAEKGNPKAIEKVLNAIEDDVIKIESAGITAIRIIRDTNV